MEKSLVNWKEENSEKILVSECVRKIAKIKLKFLGLWNQAI